MDRKINYLDTTLRSEYKKHISKNTFDILVIGGGVTGAGICLDAASRGLKTCLIEMNDFASGTSSKSTKLIHGGLRYLEQFKFGLVHETGSERAILRNIAPHIVKSEKMLLPIIKNGKLSNFSTRAALFVYDYLANVKGKDRNKMLSKNEVQSMEPLLIDKNLRGGALYSEYRTDDSRLTIDLLKRSVNYDACPINYTKAEVFLFDKMKKVIGVNCKDQLKNDKINIYSKVIINASGSWTDDILKGKKKKLVLSKGIHIVLPIKKLNIKQSLYFDAIDSRMIFAIPRGKTVYIGTTDTKYEKGKDKIEILKKEVKYLVDSINNSFNKSIEIKDVISSWVGLRPLIKDGNKKVTEISRRDEIYISSDGLITIAGGKLTGYRKMAERVVDLAQKKLKINKSRSVTKSLKLINYNYNFCKKKCKENGANSQMFNNIYNIYGDGCLEIFKIHKEIKNEHIIVSEFIYTKQNEMCHNLLDFFTQRNSVVYFEIENLKNYLKHIKKYLLKNKLIKKEIWKEEEINLMNYVKKITNFI